MKKLGIKDNGQREQEAVKINGIIILSFSLHQQISP
jgi:hypothetical protein